MAQQAAVCILFSTWTDPCEKDDLAGYDDVHPLTLYRFFPSRLGKLAEFDSWENQTRRRWYRMSHVSVCVSERDYERVCDDDHDRVC